MIMKVTPAQVATLLRRYLSVHWDLKKGKWDGIKKEPALVPLLIHNTESQETQGSPHIVMSVVTHSTAWLPTKTWGGGGGEREGGAGGGGGE